MANKSQNDLVAAAQTLARLQGRRATLMQKVEKIDQDIETVSEFLRNTLAPVPAGE